MHCILELILSNTIEIINCKQLNDIRLKFDYRDLKIDINELNLIFDKISTNRQKFLIKMNDLHEVQKGCFRNGR